GLPGADVVVVDALASTKVAGVDAGVPAILAYQPEIVSADVGETQYCGLVAQFPASPAQVVIPARPPQVGDTLGSDSGALFPSTTFLSSCSCAMTPISGVGQL